MKDAMDSFIKAMSESDDPILRMTVKADAEQYYRVLSQKFEDLSRSVWAINRAVTMIRSGEPEIEVLKATAVALAEENEHLKKEVLRLNMNAPISSVFFEGRES